MRGRSQDPSCPWLCRCAAGCVGSHASVRWCRRNSLFFLTDSRRRRTALRCRRPQNSVPKASGGIRRSRGQPAPVGPATIAPPRTPRGERLPEEPRHRTPCPSPLRHDQRQPCRRAPPPAAAAGRPRARRPWAGAGLCGARGGRAGTAGPERGGGGDLRVESGAGEFCGEFLLGLRLRLKKGSVVLQ